MRNIMEAAKVLREDDNINKLKNKLSDLEDMVDKFEEVLRDIGDEDIDMFLGPDVPDEEEYSMSGEEQQAQDDEDEARWEKENDQENNWDLSNVPRISDEENDALGARIEARRAEKARKRELAGREKR